MIDIAQCKLEQFVRQDAPSVGEAEQAVVREDRSAAHSPSVYDCLDAKIAQTAVSMNNFDSLSYHDIAENRKEGEDGRKRRLAINDKEGNVIDLKPVGQVSNT